MAYITLEELKKILPGILNQWIDEEDESWEWIFQEIEQKCHIGKKEKKKNKKKWKTKIESMVDTHSTVLSAHRNDINKLESILKGNIDNVTQLGLTIKDMGAEIRRLRNDITAAKSMAETAKQRTEVDYSKYSDGSDYTKGSEAQIIQNVYNRMANRGATKEELGSFKNVVKKYDATNYQPSNNFSYADGKTAYDCWKAKDIISVPEKECDTVITRMKLNGATNEELCSVIDLMKKYILGPQPEQEAKDE